MVKVTPRCSKSEVAGLTPDGVLKARVAAVPEKGKANEELQRLLADFFAVARSGVAILTGESAPLKRIRISR